MEENNQSNEVNNTSNINNDKNENESKIKDIKSKVYVNKNNFLKNSNEKQKNLNDVNESNNNLSEKADSNIKSTDQKSDLKNINEDKSIPEEENLIQNKVSEKADSNIKTAVQIDNIKQVAIKTANTQNENAKPSKIKEKIKPVKAIPIEKKPFEEFINDHLIPELKNELKSKGKKVSEINLKKTERPISGDICWVIYCEISDTCNFWLSFEKDDITSLKSFSLCKKYEKPSIIESFLIDEKKITLKLIISRVLQRLNGQKLIGAN